MGIRTQNARSLGNIVLAGVGLGLVAPPLVVALSLTRTPPVLAALLVAGLGVAAARHWWPQLSSLSALLLQRKLWIAAWL